MLPLQSKNKLLLLVFCGRRRMILGIRIWVSNWNGYRIFSPVIRIERARTRVYMYGWEIIFLKFLVFFLCFILEVCFYGCLSQTLELVLNEILEIVCWSWHFVSFHGTWMLFQGKCFKSHPSSKLNIFSFFLQGDNGSLISPVKIVVSLSERGKKWLVKMVCSEKGKKQLFTSFFIKF